MIKTVLFDIDNTVYSYDEAHEKAMEQVYRYCQEKFQWEKELTKILLYEAQQEEKQVLASDRGEHEALRRKRGEHGDIIFFTFPHQGYEALLLA